MKYTVLRAIRILVALCVFIAIVSFFVDVRDKLPQQLAWLEKIQFVSAATGGGLLIAVAILIATALFGRVYCSVVCPLGILQDIFSWLSGRVRLFFAPKQGAKAAPVGEGKQAAPKVKRPKKPFAWKNYSFSKNHIGVRAFFLIYAIVAGFVGLFYFGLLDPYGIFGRIAVNVFKPLNVMANNGLFEYFSKSESEQWKTAFYHVALRPESGWALVVGLVSFVGIAIFAGLRGRLYCNTICPVGTLLGILSRFSLLRTRIDASKCVSCGLCEKRCKSSCIDAKSKTVDASRCVVCFDCFGACRKDAIHFGFGRKPELAPNETAPNSETNGKLDEATLKEKGRIEREIQGYDPSKRQFIALTALAATAAVAKFAGADDPNPSVENPEGAGETADETEEAKPADYGQTPYKQNCTIMPPGAPSKGHYMHHCVGCHLCVAKCPSHVLKPSGFENGLLGFMQPKVDFSHGFCNFDCTTCGDVCPAKAILPLTVEQKHVTQMGQVVFIKENCIVYAKDEHCGACSEHCPTQAVHMVPYGDNGLTIPETSPEMCVGCGGCEYICPARPYRAIYIEGLPVQKEATPPPKEEAKQVEEVDFGF
ncbi:MAG: 4Fe-4S binding protein [Thermoguttaceae bacterium]|nr:4Fe-4S binding protein [Thermoguttaceae bacterium]